MSTTIALPVFQSFLATEGKTSITFLTKGVACWSFISIVFCSLDSNLKYQLSNYLKEV
jgi:hypothetical protein